MQILTIKAFTSLIYSLLIAFNKGVIHSTNTYPAIHNVQAAGIGPYYKPIPLGTSIAHEQRIHVGYQYDNVLQAVQECAIIQNADFDEVGDDRYHIVYTINIQFVDHTQEEILAVKEQIAKAINKYNCLFHIDPSDMQHNCNFTRWDQPKSLSGNLVLNGAYHIRDIDPIKKITTCAIGSIDDNRTRRHEIAHMLHYYNTDGIGIPFEIADGIANLVAFSDADLRVAIDKSCKWFMDGGALSHFSVDEVMDHTNGTTYRYDLWPVIIDYIERLRYGRGAIRRYTYCIKESSYDQYKKELCKTQHIKANFNLEDFKKRKLKLHNGKCIGSIEPPRSRASPAWRWSDAPVLIRTSSPAWRWSDAPLSIRTSSTTARPRNMATASPKKSRLNGSTDTIVLVCDPLHCEVRRSIHNNESIAVIIVREHIPIEQFNCRGDLWKHWVINETNHTTVNTALRDHIAHGCKPISTTNSTILLLCDANKSKCEVFRTVQNNESVTVFIVKGYHNAIEQIDCRDVWKDWVINRTNHASIPSDIMANTKYYSGCNIIKAISGNSASSGLTTTAVGPLVGFWVIGAMATPIMLPFNRRLLW